MYSFHHITNYERDKSIYSTKTKLKLLHYYFNQNMNNFTTFSANSRHGGV